MGWKQTLRNIFLIVMVIEHGQYVRLRHQQASDGRFMVNAWLLRTLVCPELSPRSLSSPLCIVIDSEVRYAVRYEYAQTAVDVIARRTRLAFLNAQAAFDALPCIVDIMAEELGWSYAQRRKQIAAAVRFLGSMGLPPALTISSNLPEPIPKSWLDRIERSFWRTGRNILSLVQWGNIAQRVDETDTFTPSRSKFEPGEVAALRNAFNRRTKVAEGIEKVISEEILSILKEIPAYADITKKELDYVLDEAGLRERAVSFDEFIEVGSTFGL